MSQRRKCTVLCTVSKKKTKAMEQQKQKSKQTSKQKTTTSQENISDVAREKGRGWKLHIERTYYTTCLRKNDSESPTHKTIMKKKKILWTFRQRQKAKSLIKKIRLTSDCNSNFYDSRQQNDTLGKKFIISQTSFPMLKLQANI